jgi:hypothetical protein
MQWSGAGMLPLLLIGQAKVFKHGKAKTLYVSIPSKVAQDSAFTIREGDMVEVEFKKDLDAVIIKKKSAKKSPSQ